MLSNGAQPPQRFIGMRPGSELLVHRLNDKVQGREVAVVQTEAASQFPNSFDGVEVRTVGWQVVQTELGLLLRAPICVKFGVVPVLVTVTFSSPGNSLKAACNCAAVALYARCAVV